MFPKAESPEWASWGESYSELRTCCDSLLVIRHRDCKSLFEGAESLAGLIDGILAQRVHSLLEREILDFVGRLALDDQSAELLGDRNQLKNGETAGIPRVLAIIATMTAEKLCGFRLLVVHPELLAQLLRNLDGLLAVGANSSHQTLSAGQGHAGCDQERLDLHVNEAGDGTGGIIGVQGAQHLVTG